MRRSWHTPGLRMLLVLLLLSGVSCGREGPRLYPVHGHVFHQNKPAAGAMVVFHPVGSDDPQALRPAAVVGDDGSFALGTHAPGDGAPAGEYIITIDWLVAAPESASEDAESDLLGVDRLRGRYSNPRTSRMRVQVKEGSNELEAFQLR